MSIFAICLGFAVLSHSAMSHSLRLHRLQPTSPLSMGILQARVLEWVAISCSRGVSQPRDQTQVSCIAGGFLTEGATREASGWGYCAIKIELQA